MKKKSSAMAALCGAAALAALLFQNCSPVHLGGEGSFASLSACQGGMATEFKRGYYPFLKANCATCHTSGPGSGFFASPAADLAFSYFFGKGAQKVSEFAVSSHKPPYTGAQHTAQINNLRAAWAPAEAAYIDCQVKLGGELPPTFALQPTKMLANKSANPALNQTVTLTWDTATDFVDQRNAYAGGSIALTVRAVSTGGVNAYQFENLRFINAGANPAYIKTLALYVNDVVVDGESYLYVERYIPNVAANNSRRLIQGAAYFGSPTIGTAINVKLAIGVLSAADIDFRPVTFTALASPGGIFAVNCQSCHGTAGGLSLALANYNNIIGRTANSDKTLVSPYTLLDNFIYARMSDAANPMPSGGPLLPEADRDRVRDWILDGAPLNDAAIAR